MIKEYKSPIWISIISWMLLIILGALYSLLMPLIALLTWRISVLMRLKRRTGFIVILSVLAYAYYIDLSFYHQLVSHIVDVWGFYQTSSIKQIIILSKKLLMSRKGWYQYGHIGILYGSIIYIVDSYLCWITTRDKQEMLLAVLKEDVADDGSILGFNSHGESYKLTDKAANKHVLAVGTTGSGKTVSICNIVKSAIDRNIPVIYIDGKGDEEIGKSIVNYAKNKGTKGYLVSMYEQTVTYDPLYCGGYTSKKDRIIELREWTEEYYKKLAEGYLQLVFRILDACGVSSDLNNLAEYMNFNKLRGLLRNNIDKVPDAQILMNQLNQKEEASESINNVTSEIQNFTESEIGHLFSKQEGKEHLNLYDLIKDKAVAYFSLPSLQYPSMSKTLGKLVINDIKASIENYTINNPLQPVYVIFDEFSVFAGDQVLNIINMGRSKGLHAILSTQSLSDIGVASNKSDHFIQQIISNCNNYIIHRQNSPHDAEMLSNVIGTKNSSQLTMKYSSDHQDDRTGSIRSVKEFKVHPNQIKELDVGTAFVFSKDTHKAVKLKMRNTQLC